MLDRSGPRHPYFLGMQDALHGAGIAWPTLVIDKARLNRNIELLEGSLPPGMGYRIVAKSLPSLPLISHVRERTGTDRLMVFNLPMLEALSASMPEADQLLGKPLPVQVARSYLQGAHASSVERVQWLVDTVERLTQYARAAEEVEVGLRVNLEIDIGLHRGGFAPNSGGFDRALEQIAGDHRLQFAGFVGYEPHIPHLPSAFGLRRRALDQAWDLYRLAQRKAGNALGREAVEASTRNAGGSPTFRLYRDTTIANEIAAGSCLVKPSDFDLESLSDFLPAAFIATPVLKVQDTTSLPGLEFAERLTRHIPNRAETIFLHGGRWLADPVDPPGLRFNPLYGRSSNQEMLNSGPQLAIAVDDFVFLRPTQSEAVFLQFGNIAVFENGAISEFWPALPPSA